MRALFRLCKPLNRLDNVANYSTGGSTRIPRIAKVKIIKDAMNKSDNNESVKVVARVVAAPEPVVYFALK